MGCSSLWRTKELRAKGYDCAELGMWLCRAGRLSRLRQSCVQFGVGSKFFLTVLHSKDLLSRQEASQTRVVGQFWLKFWLTFANREPGRWRLRPKFHLLFHFVCSADDGKSLRSPICDGWNVDGRRVDQTNRSDNSKKLTKKPVQRRQFAGILCFYSKSCSKAKHCERMR